MVRMTLISPLQNGAANLVKFEGRTQCGAKPSIVLDVPLATYRLVAGFATFVVEQHPLPPSRRFRANSSVVSLEASFQVSSPTNIGSAVVSPSTSQHINEEECLALWDPLSHEFLVRISA